MAAWLEAREGNQQDRKFALEIDDNGEGRCRTGLGPRSSESILCQPARAGFEMGLSKQDANHGVLLSAHYLGFADTKSISFPLCAPSAMMRRMATCQRM